MAPEPARSNALDSRGQLVPPAVNEAAAGRPPVPAVDLRVPATTEVPRALPDRSPVPGLQPASVDDRTELRRGVLAIVTIAVVLLVVAVLASQLGGSAVPRATGASTPGAGQTEPPSPAAEPPSTPGPSSPGGSLGVLPAEGLTASAAVTGSDTVEVVETVYWPAGGPTTLRLQVPSDALADAGVDVDLQPSVEALQVSLDGEPAVPEAVVGTPSSWLVPTASGAAPQVLELRYVLRGAIARSLPARPGRALAVLTPIAAELVTDLPTRLFLSSENVLNVYCPTAPTPDGLLCGRLDGDRWVITPPPGIPLAVAQVDLPPPV